MCSYRVVQRARFAPVTMIVVRSANDGDVETMAAIYVDAARTGWAHIFGESGLDDLQPPVDRLRAELASTDPRLQVLAAEREGRVIGFAVIRPSRDADADGIQVGELDQFYSDPATWGQGRADSYWRPRSTHFATTASQRRLSG